LQFFQTIADRIREAAHTASHTSNNPEGKLRELVAPLWDECLRHKKINLNFTPKDERTLANGRADTVFNRLILEYKKPGVINQNNKKNWKLIAQVRTYIEDLSKEERWKEERLLGIAFDGKYFLYIRKIGRWTEEEPAPINSESIERFILTLEKLTSKAALIPDNLIRDFAVGAGSLNYIAANTIKAFYFTLTANKNERVKAFFDQWVLQFSEVHGTIENKKFDAETLFQSYGFKKQEQKNFNFLAFFFALDTYYAILMKLLAYQVVGFYVLRDVIGLPLLDWEKYDSDSLKEKLNELEEGGIFRNLGIRNFLEGDLLSWYLNSWNSDIYGSLKNIINRLNQYDPETMELVPEQTRDILKKLYQFLVPRVIRHDLGEYYTPDWLAERCLDMVGYGPKLDGLLQKRILDPGCGSGTFVILAIKRAREYAKNKSIKSQETLKYVTRNIIGFDLNPLAVISARTNYLLAIADLIKHRGKDEVTIPVYLCDSINPPSATQSASLFEGDVGTYDVRTSVGTFSFPDNIIKKQLIQEITLLLEDSVKKQINSEKFTERLSQTLSIENKDEANRIFSILVETFLKLAELENKGINGIWSRIIKNAFAPLFVGQFDFIVGNPPWVNWESLPDEYRTSTASLWQKYNLFEHTGLKARSGSAKDDISVLMTYVSIDKYLKLDGKLSFVITQSLFKTAGGGEGFRRFKLGKNGIPFKIIQVDDLTNFQPFDSATNKTSVFTCQKGSTTKYPIDYSIWHKKEGSIIDLDTSAVEIPSLIKTSYLKAQSIDGSLQGPWLTARPKVFGAIKKIVGSSTYRAREGSSGGLNSVYIVEIISQEYNSLQIKNYTANAKVKVKAVEAMLEPDLVFPTLRGREIKKWFALPELSLIVPHSPSKASVAIKEDILKLNYPLTFKYLSTFKENLLDRSLYKLYLKNQPFYAMYNTGEYSFSPYKVVWTRVGTDLKCAVVDHSLLYQQNQKVITPIETVVFIPLDNLEESHYCAALLNCSLTRFTIVSYSNKSAGSFASPHILENINIPPFNKSSTIHKDLSNYSQQCHERTASGIQVQDLENQIDLLAAELWGLTKQELIDIKESFEEVL
jgi:methylase of polypeptide subunit release factors